MLDSLLTRRASRRDFLWMGAFAVGGAVAPALVGCAKNPVTGESQLMLLSEEGEIAIDKKYAPHQFSSDYGLAEDRALQSYVRFVGDRMAPLTHRPRMPYNFQCVNAVYVNAYAFPGGSIASTRGIMLEMEDEAEFAALMGHEMGHVNARHTASRMSTGQLLQGLLGLATVGAAQAGGDTAAQAVGQLGGLGAGALLASYSRDDERQADQLGMEYMTRAEYDPAGMVGLMDMLRSMKKREPSAVERIFSTHPLGEERYRTAVARLESDYAFAKGFPRGRERYMDATQGLRARKDAIEAMQQAEKRLGNKEYPAAEEACKAALGFAPDDYVALMLMSKTQMALKRPQNAAAYAADARAVQPEEAQSYHVGGVAELQQKRYDQALSLFTGYEKRLGGNPVTDFLQGYCLEQMGRRRDSAVEYKQYLSQTNQGELAQYAYTRLKQWGYVR